MVDNKYSLVFLGTGPVAADSLVALSKEFDIEHVITKEAPRHHRGSVPVLELAHELNMSVSFANTEQQLDAVIASLPYKSPVGIIVDYGVIVSKEVISVFPLGIINSHFSLLPEWRGADPITYTVLSGQTNTGVSLMKIVEKLDEGQLIAQEELPIPAGATTPELTSLLVKKSNDMLLRYLPPYIKGKLKPYDQPNRPITHSYKLTKDEGVLDWSKPAVQLERQIRAFIEWPKSRTTLGGKDVIITKSHVVPGSGQPPGTISKVSRTLTVACGTQALSIDSLIPAGKRAMTIQAFLAGYGHLL